jgi:acyl-CoA synthetase (AMP-forming)/AMP-acid ligase II
MRDLATAVDLPDWAAHADIAPLLDAARRADPPGIALADGIDPSLTRQALWQLAAGIAHHVQALAPAEGALGLLAATEARSTVAMLGCLLAGLPFAVLSPQDPPARRAAIIAACGLGTVLADPGLEVPDGVRRLALDAAAPAASPPPCTSGPDAPALILPTSGSTGLPKGIVHSRRTLLFRTGQLRAEWVFRPGDRFLALGAGNTVGSLVNCLAAMLSGALLLRPDVRRLGLDGVLAAAREQGGVTGLQAVPSLLRALLALPEAAAALAPLRACQASGEPLLAADIVALQAALPRGCELVNVYGLTEAPALLRWVAPPDYQTDDARVPAGRPLPGHALALLDPEGRPVPPGEPGELVVTGRFLALGDWQAGRLVQGARLGPAPDMPGARRLRTGDLAQLRPDGQYAILGRIDRQVKINGQRVELATIEAALRHDPDVLEAAVVVETPAGTSPRLFAAVVPRDLAKAEALLVRLRAALRLALPVALQPRRLVALPALPLLPGGKLDALTLLAAIAATPAAAAPAPTALEARVARAWQRCLGSAPRAAESFFDAGGDSLAFLGFRLALERIVGRRLPYDTVRMDMTVAELAAAVAAPPAAPVVARPAGPPTVLLFPGQAADLPDLAAIRAGCTGIDFVLWEYPDWRAVARAGGTLEPMIEAGVALALRSFPPGTPILLAGYSFGGGLAYAVALRLAALGRPVAHLFILDTDLVSSAVPPPGGSGTPRRRRSLRERLERRLEWRFVWLGRTPRAARLAARPGRLALDPAECGAAIAGAAALAAGGPARGRAAPADDAVPRPRRGARDARSRLGRAGSARRHPRGRRRPSDHAGTAARGLARGRAAGSDPRRGGMRRWSRASALPAMPPQRRPLSRARAGGPCPRSSRRPGSASRPRPDRPAARRAGSPRQPSDRGSRRPAAGRRAAACGIPRTARPWRGSA